MFAPIKNAIKRGGAYGFFPFFMAMDGLYVTGAGCAGVTWLNVIKWAQQAAPYKCKTNFIWNSRWKISLR
jgi:hypothetical protein